MSKWPMSHEHTMAAEARELAVRFRALRDEYQAQFFVELAALNEPYTELDMLQNWYAVGAYLKLCQCSTDGARRLVEKIAEGARDGAPR